MLVVSTGMVRTEQARLHYGGEASIRAAARGLPKRHPPAVRRALDEQRLLIVSPFPAAVTRITADTARHRNAFMLAVADHIVIGRLTPGGILAEALSTLAPHKEVTRLDEA